VEGVEELEKKRKKVDGGVNQEEDDSERSIPQALPLVMILKALNGFAKRELDSFKV